MTTLEKGTREDGKPWQRPVVPPNEWLAEPCRTTCGDEECVMVIVTGPEYFEPVRCTAEWADRIIASSKTRRGP